nr:cytidine deaminase [Eisenibacter elegans]
MPMTQQHLTLTYERLHSIEAFPTDEQTLIRAAQAACHTAYAPYSGFWVGAALLLANGEIVSGSNQENGAYPSGLCAERVAFFQASSRYKDVPILKAAVVAYSPQSGKHLPANPCGGCRQVMVEYEQKQAQDIGLIILAEPEVYYRFERVQTLMPFGFVADFLKQA